MTTTIRLKHLWQGYDGIEETHGSAGIEWGDAETEPMIVWNESLQFHCELTSSDIGTPQAIRDLVAAEGDPFLNRVRDELGKLLPSGFDHDVSWATSDYDDEDPDAYPEVALQVWWKGEMDPEGTAARAREILQPAINTLFNVTDPGTFNSPYLFSDAVMLGNLD